MVIWFYFFWAHCETEYQVNIIIVRQHEWQRKMGQFMVAKRQRERQEGARE
jgi:hypothetical protein